MDAIIACTRENHDRVLATYRRPKELIATKSSLDARAYTGDDADLQHDIWIIRTEDPNKVRSPEQTLDFTTIVCEGGLRLNSFGQEADLLTAKIIALEFMRGQYLPSVVAVSIHSRLLDFCWLVRWRLGERIERFGRLTPPLFDVFCSRLREGGLMGLVLLEERIIRLEQRALQGMWAWPTVSFQRRTCLDWSAIASELGIPPLGPGLSPVLRARLTEAIANTATCEIHWKGGKASNSPEIEGDDDSEYEERSDEPGAILSITRVQGVLSVWEAMYKLSSFGLLPHDPLGFDPFLEVSLSDRAKSSGRCQSGGGRTVTLEAKTWLELFEAAARWVLDYAEPLQKIVAGAQDAYQVHVRNKGYINGDCRRVSVKATQSLIEKYWPSEAPTLAAMWRRGNNWKIDDRRIPLDEAVQHLAVACLVLIGGFGARRRNELLSLQVGCIRQDHNGCWLSTYIEKTIRDLDEIPVPTMVDISIVRLEALSASGRKRKGTPWLIDIDRPCSNGQSTERLGLGLHLSISSAMNAFAAVMGIQPPVNSQGKPGFFSPHQLRRAFGIYYYHGNRFSNLDALSRFLRHFDPEQTRRYVNEAMGGSLMRLREITRARSELLAKSKAKNKESDNKCEDNFLKHAKEAAQGLKERQRTFQIVREETFVSRVMEVYDGEEEPIGLGAATLLADLNKLVEMARGRIRLTGRNGSPGEERKALVGVLKEYARDHFLEPVSGGHAHCMARPGVVEDIPKELCLQVKAQLTGQTGDTRPDYAYASRQTCLECHLSTFFSENQRQVRQHVEGLDVAAANAPSEDQREAARRKAEAAKASVLAARAAVVNRSRS